MVRLFSDKSVESVLDFYKTNIPESLSSKEFYGTHYFWTGNEDDAMMAHAPSIQISNAYNFKDIWSEANSIITIYYK